MPKPNPPDSPAARSPNPEADPREAAFLETLLARLPDHARILEALGHLYTALGRHEDGLRADRQLVQLRPNSPLAWYNLGCSLALTRQTDEAFAALEKAVALGYRDWAHLQADPDLAGLHSDPRFPRLVARLRACSD